MYKNWNTKTGIKCYKVTKFTHGFKTIARRGKKNVPVKFYNAKGWVM